MESAFQRKLSGYVVAELSGNNIERFFNLCRYRGVFPANIRREKDGVVCEFLIDDYRRIRPAALKTGTGVRLQKKCGLPFFIYKYRKRPAIFVCAVLSCVFLWFMSGRIWSMEFSGNSYYSSETLQNFLESAGIKNGMNKDSIICNDIEAKLRIEFEYITWVSVQIDGTLLKVNIKENLNTQKVPEPDEGCVDVTSAYDGSIISIVTRSGTPLVKAGSTVSKGDVLISGVIDLKNDNGEVVDHRYVKADGDCYIKTVLEVDEKIDKSYEVANVVKTNKGFCVKIGGLENTFLLPVFCSYPASKTTQIYQLCLFDNFYLPVYWGDVSIEYLETEVKYYTDQEFLEVCDNVLCEKIRNLEKKGVEILENNVIIQSEEFCARLKGTLTVKVAGSLIINGET